MTSISRILSILLTFLSLSPFAITPAVADVSKVTSNASPYAAPANMPWPLSASLSDPTDRYPHNVLGRIPSFTTLTVEVLLCEGCPKVRSSARLTLTAPLVFEDVAPRLWDITGDGRPEIVVVQSHENLGARLTVWALRDAEDAAAPLFKMIATTDFIGTRFRWLTPFGAGDFTGDGRTEIAYVETPHLGKVLRLVALEGDRLVERAALAGVTNHRIGEETISGTVRNCNGRVEAILASSDWQRMVAVHWQNGVLSSRDLGPLRDVGQLTGNNSCR
jgi:hypothetical protein